MAKIINSKRLSDTTVGGSSNVDFSFSLGVMCKQIVIEFETSGTTFDFDIIDKDSESVFERDSESSTYNELVELPLSGNYTAQIRNASKDESFYIKFIAHEI